MLDDILTSYERELAFLQQIGEEFAAKSPKIASRLLLESNKTEEPHIERLIQAFASLAGRIHHKIDDEFPEITDVLLGVRYPHYLAPIPSMSIVQFVMDVQQGKLTSGHLMPRGTPLYSQPVAGSPCRFRTCYPVTLWPVEVTAARIEEADRQRRSADAVAAIAQRCTVVESGARNVDHILTRTLLPEIARDFLARIAEGQRITKVHGSVDAGGAFQYEIA